MLIDDLQAMQFQDQTLIGERGKRENTKKGRLIHIQIPTPTSKTFIYIFIL